MPQTQITSNPFALMMDPEAVFAAIERSERLSSLKSRICRPLDQPRPPCAGADIKAFDEAIEATPETELNEPTLSEGEQHGEASAD